MCVVTLLSYARAQLPMRTSHTCSDEMRFTSICVLMATRIQSKLAICKPMRYVNPLCVSPVFPIPMEDHDAPPTVDGYAAKRPPTRRGTKLRWRASECKKHPKSRHASATPPSNGGRDLPIASTTALAPPEPTHSRPNPTSSLTMHSWWGNADGGISTGHTYGLNGAQTRGRTPLTRIDRSPRIRNLAPAARYARALHWPAFR